MDHTTKLQLFDADTQITYEINLSAEDYQRAITDTAYASQLLLNIQQSSALATSQSQLSKEKGSENQSYDIDQPASSSEERCQWQKKDILLLIDLYEKHQSMFKSTTIRNEKVWESIANEIKRYSPEQCKNKFKYLKSKYIKKKENMGSRRTGESPITFEYFDELDRLFGSQPNIIPIATASSSKGYIEKTDHKKRSRKDDEEELEEEDQQPMTSAETKKSKKSKSVNELKRMFEQKEQEKTKRHEENIKLKNDALQLLRKLTENLTSDK